MGRVIAGIAAWLLPAVLVLCVVLVVGVRQLCSDVVNAVRRSRAGSNVGDERGPLPQ